MASEPSGPRAAQIQAVRDLLNDRAIGYSDPDLAAQLVDAVHAAGRDKGERPTPHLDRVKAELAEANERADQGEARGWAKAVGALLDDQRFDAWRREHAPLVSAFHWARRHAADYLEAVGPDGTAGLPAAVDGPESASVAETTNPARSALSDQRATLSRTSAETGQDGAGVDAGCGGADAGGSDRG